MRVVVAPADAGERADKVVTSALAIAVPAEPISRATVQRWMRAGRVLAADGTALTDPSQKLRAGLELVVSPEPPPRSEAAPDPSIAVTILFEDDDLIIVDKPAGLVVHPARGHETGTLVNGLLGRSLTVAGDDEDWRMRPGIVHRLDKGTSGVMVVAKNPFTREALRVRFAAHDLERRYVAIVVGAARDATIETLYGRDARERMRFTTFVREGKRAVTHVRVREPLKHATLVACTLETGRTHQIRVHLAERMKTPVLGDPVYGSPPTDRELRALAAELGHQALHAELLGFEHPRTREPMRFTSAPPVDFQRALALLRGATRPSI
ncbi:MAG: RluA family pseudouridine synthase [Polyangiaceae bacterium]